MIETERKVIASLYFKGLDLDPLEVTKVLGVNPTVSHGRGEIHKTSSGNEFATKTGFWGLVVNRDSAEVSDVVMELLAILKGNHPPWNISGLQEAYFDIFIAVSLDEDCDGTCAMELPSVQMRALAQYSLPVRITVTMGHP